MLSKDLNAVYEKLFVKPHQTLKMIEDIALNYVDDKGYELITNHCDITNLMIYDDLEEFINETELKLNDELDSIVVSQYDTKQNKFTYILPLKYIELSKEDLQEELIKDAKQKHIPLI